MVGTLAGTENYFAGTTGIESHFGVGCNKCPAGDGAIWQWMDTNKRADANLDANGFAISVETCDHYTGGTYTNPPLTDKQIDAWINIGLWAAKYHNIPRRRCDAWNGSGMGYHSMWGAPSHWTPSAGKTCPNPTRIKQFNEEVLPGIISGSAGEDDLSAEAEKQIDAIHDGMVVPGTKTVAEAFELLFNRVKTIEDALQVPGATTVKQSVEIMYRRVQKVEDGIDLICDHLGIPFEQVDPDTITG